MQAIMQTIFTGKAYVFGDNVDTDQMIPAQYLTFNPSIPEEYRQFGKHALVACRRHKRGSPRGTSLFTPMMKSCRLMHYHWRQKFWCGSSHAPIALDAAGIKVVIAEFYARIFYRNSVNGGYLTPVESVDRLCERICTGDELRVDLLTSLLHNLTTGEDWALKPLGEVSPSWRLAGYSIMPTRWAC